MPADLKDIPTAAGRDEKIRELSELVGTFSDISDKLKDSHAALTDKVTRLQEELAEKNRLLARQQEMLSDKQKQLERKNRLAALGEMAAGLAHEIRNPLGGIGLNAAMLADDLADRPDALPLIESIRNGVRRMERTVSQVLRFAGEVVAEPRQGDLAILMRETLDLARGEAQRQGVELMFDGPARLPAFFDADLLGRAVLNLVLNAIEVASVVRLRVAREGDCVRITVSDNGPGLPKGVDAERLFDPFFTTRDTGTGLGLSIVYRIAEAHGGSVHACNGSDGGAIFTLVL